MSSEGPTPRSRHGLIVRLDYGYPALDAPGWAEGDLSRQPLDEALRAARGAPGLVLRHAEWALAWAGTREGGSLWPRLAALARRPGLVLECRFPRHARDIDGLLRAAGLQADTWETPASGALPPLYGELAASPVLRRLHLDYEWATGMGAARGGAALLRIAVLLAREGPAAVPELAARLSLTAGACRAYLTWMEDAALARREGRAFALRHPLLAELFTQERPGQPLTAPRAGRLPRRSASLQRPSPSPSRQPTGMDWD